MKVYIDGKKAVRKLKPFEDADVDLIIPHKRGMSDEDFELYNKADTECMKGSAYDIHKSFEELLSLRKAASIGMVLADVSNRADKLDRLGLRKSVQLIRRIF